MRSIVWRAGDEGGRTSRKRPAILGLQGFGVEIEPTVEPVEPVEAFSQDVRSILLVCHCA